MFIGFNMAVLGIGFIKCMPEGYSILGYCLVTKYVYPYHPMIVSLSGHGEKGCVEHLCTFCVQALYLLHTSIEKP